MKKIINGKLYNTETATELANRSRCYPRDFNYISETLYRKKTGEYFLYGEGGPNTTYSEPVGDSGWASGWNIIPMSELEARSWMELHCDADEYIAAFGEPEE